MEGRRRRRYHELRFRDHESRRRPGDQGRSRGDRRLNVRLRLFARAREAAGRGEEVVRLDAGATLAALLTQARHEFGREFEEVLAASRVWINGEEPSAGDDTRLADGDEVAVLPPVSGG
ncbi:MAG: MoaD/ThiS family protein [Acidimicrobiia bacterium]